MICLFYSFSLYLVQRPCMSKPPPRTSRHQFSRSGLRTGREACIDPIYKERERRTLHSVKSRYCPRLVTFRVHSKGSHMSLKMQFEKARPIKIDRLPRPAAGCPSFQIHGSGRDLRRNCHRDMVRSKRNNMKFFISGKWFMKKLRRLVQRDEAHFRAIFESFSAAVEKEEIER